MESNLKKTMLNVFYVVKLFLFLNIFEVSFISLKRTKFSPLLTSKIDLTHSRHLINIFRINK